jgi:hypothetical protein
MGGNWGERMLLGWKENVYAFKGIIKESIGIDISCILFVT